MTDEMKKPQPPMFVGYGWYVEEEYGKLLAVADDAANLPQSFEVWRQNAEQGFQDELRRGERTVIKIEVSVDDLIAFCRTRDGKVNGPNRNAFINKKVFEFVRDNRLVDGV